MPRIHAFGDDALADRDAVGLVAAIQDGEVSIPEVIEAAVARTERLRPDLGAVSYVAYERARAEAREAVERTHRQYRRDLVPLRQAPVPYRR